MSKRKKCPVCGVEKPLTKTHWYAKRDVQGKPRFQAKCKSCDNLSRMARRRAKREVERNNNSRKEATSRGGA
jgi:hypothetical protein